MILILKKTATPSDILSVASEIKRLGLKPHISVGDEKTIIGVIGDLKAIEPSSFEFLPAVEKIMRASKPFKLTSREFHPANTLVRINSHTTLGESTFTVMAGPCAVESPEQVMKTAVQLRASGVNILRGGAYKPRSSPYSFKGLRKEGLQILGEVKAKTGLAIITEAVSAEDLPDICEVADVVQIGARNMQNFHLLEAVGKIQKPVLLKRGMGSTLEELLLSAEYILAEGNPNIILCERGIRTFEKYTRNTLDISAVLVLKELSHLPVIVDPSHATGNWRWVPGLAKAALVAGADGLLVEVHPDPEKALCDGSQSLNFDLFTRLMQDLHQLAPLSNTVLDNPPTCAVV